jgi:membrane protein
VFRALRAVSAGFRAHRGLFLAAGLAFSLMVCVIPFLFLVVALAGFVLSHGAAAEAVLGQLGQMVPVYRRELHDLLEQIISRRALSGVLGTAVLLLFAMQLFASLRLVLNEVFAFTQGPGLLREMAKDLGLMALMGVLFLASIAITDLVAWVKILFLTPVGMPAGWIRAVFVAVALAFNVGLFFIAYRYFPHRRVPVVPALGGALLASVLWEAAKQAFRVYIRTVGVYDLVYGPLAVLVALSMFAYYSAVVFVLGAEYAAALRDAPPAASRRSA